MVASLANRGSAVTCAAHCDSSSNNSYTASILLLCTLTNRKSPYLRPNKHDNHLTVFPDTLRTGPHRRIRFEPSSGRAFLRRNPLGNAMQSESERW